MSDDFFDPIEDSAPRRSDMIQRIAEALGISAAAFLSGPMPDADIDDTVEMLRIWCSFVHAADRRKVLAFTRAIAAARL